MNAAVPNVPPPEGMVKGGAPAGQDKVPPVPPLLVKAVVNVALVTVPALPVTLPAMALVTVMSVANSLVSLEPVVPIVCPDVWSVNTAPDRLVR